MCYSLYEAWMHLNQGFGKHLKQGGGKKVFTPAEQNPTFSQDKALRGRTFPSFRSSELPPGLCAGDLGSMVRTPKARTMCPVPEHG